jgi:hypothetical protein
MLPRDVMRKNGSMSVCMMGTVLCLIDVAV